MAKKYSENENLASRDLGRPAVSDCEKQLTEYLRANDEEQIALNGLKKTHGYFSKGFSTRSLYYKMD